MKEAIVGYIYLIQNIFWITLILQWRAGKVFNQSFNYVPLLKLNFMATTAAVFLGYALVWLGADSDAAKGFGFLVWYFTLKKLMDLSFANLPTEVTGRKIATVITTTILVSFIGILILGCVFAIF